MWWSEKLGLQRVKEGLEAAGAAVTAALAEGAESLAAALEQNSTLVTLKYAAARPIPTVSSR